ncbi:MAG TPA: beta-galactosidase trimerization domain-containing protein, partial [bacterium]|nr:beta-galactosidase trimerization domain-containing protein [bacterium]
YTWEVPEEVRQKKPDWREENIQELLNHHLKYFSTGIETRLDRYLLSSGLKPFFWLNFTASGAKELKALGLPFSGPSYFHPAYLSRFEEKITAWLKEVAQEKTDAWVMFDDEASSRILYSFKNLMPDGLVFPQDVKERWSREIRERYGYGKYGPPSNFEGSPFQWLAYRKWAWHKYAEVQEKFYQKIKQARPDFFIAANNIFSIYFAPVWDYRLLGNCDFMMVDPYPTQLETRRAKAGHFMPGFMTKLVKDISGKPVVCICQAFVYHQVPVKSEWLQEWVSQVFRAGGDGIDWYAHRFPYEKGGCTKYADPELWDVMLQISKKVAEMRRVTLPSASTTAVLYSTDAYGAKIVTGQTWDMGQFEGQEVYSCYAVVGQKAGSWFTFVDDNILEEKPDLLQKYKILYIPYAEYERKSVVKAVEEFVRGGGVLVCGDPLAFSFSPDGEALSKERERLLGVRTAGPNYQASLQFKGSQTFLASWKDTRLNLWPDQYSSSTSRNVEILDPSAVVLARFDNGEPAIVQRHLGRGTVIYFAANPFTPEAIGETGWIQLFQEIQRRHGGPVNQAIWNFLIPVEFRKTEKWCLAPASGKPSGTGNLIRNGTLERDDDHDGFPDFWRPNLEKGAPRESYRWEDGYEGKGLCLDNSVAQKWAEISTTVSGIKPGTDYRLSLWVKQTEALSLQLLTRGKDFKYYYLPKPPPNQWTLMEKVVNSGSNEGNWTISFLVENLPMKVWLDNVRLEEAGQSLGKSPASSPGTPALPLRNSSFESDTNGDGWPDDWEKYPIGVAAVQITADHQVSHSGQCSLRISSSEVTRAGIIQKNIAVVPAGTYLFRMWAKSDRLESSDVGAAVFFRWSPLAPQQYLDLNMLKGTQNWKLISRQVTVPENARTMNLQIEIYKGLGTIWIDEVQFEPLP